MRLAVAFLCALAAAGFGACSSGEDVNLTVEQAVSDLVDSLAAKDAAKLASLMDISREEAGGLIANSFAGLASEVRLVEDPDRKPECDELSDEQRDNGLSALCRIGADLQFRGSSDELWQDLTLQFVVEICRGRPIVSSDTEQFEPKCR